MSKRKIKKRRKSKKRKIKKRRKSKKRKIKTKSSNSSELIFKVQKNGQIMHMLIKIFMKKNINYHLKIMKDFGKKKESELIGLNHTKK